MTVQEKLAIQTLIIDEMAQHQQDQPTMLVDALLADQGFPFLHHLLSRRLHMATQSAQMVTQLLRSLNPPAEPQREEVA